MFVNSPEVSIKLPLEEFMDKSVGKNKENTVEVEKNA